MLPAWAQDTGKEGKPETTNPIYVYKTLVLVHRDGTKTRLDMNDKPLITFPEGGGVVVTSAAVSFTFAFTDLYKITYERENINPYINPIHLGINTAEVKTSGDQVTLPAPASKIRVLSPSGRKIIVPVITESSESSTTVNLGNLSSGVYIINYGTHSFKFKKP